jgi:queuosine precursor transporter
MPRSLFIYSLIYGGLVTIAGVLGSKLAAIGPLTVEAGIFAFLPLVALSSAVAELHGKAVADKLVRYGFIPLILAMVLIAIVIALPHPPFWSQQDAFQSLLGQGVRMQLAGLISYGISQTLNVSIFARLAGSGVGNLIWLRGMIAGILSQIVDTVLFITISFYGTTDPATGAATPVLQIMTGQIIAKMVLSAVLLPLLISALVSYGRKLDQAAPTA